MNVGYKMENFSRIEKLFFIQSAKVLSFQNLSIESITQIFIYVTHVYTQTSFYIFQYFLGYMLPKK